MSNKKMDEADLEELFYEIEAGTRKMTGDDWGDLIENIEDSKLLEMIYYFGIKHDDNQHILISK